MGIVNVNDDSFCADGSLEKSDLFAMIRRRALRVEGNLQPFMANLLWFKDVLAAPRGAQAASGS